MDIFHEILSALEIEERVVLATIISTSGSTPASALSKMLVRTRGSVTIGTVGGGCVEGDVLKSVKQCYEFNTAQILTFHLKEDEFIQGLICGGTLDMLLEPIARDQRALYQSIQLSRDEGEDCIVGTHLDRDNRIVRKELIAKTVRGDVSWNNEALEYWDSALRHSPVQSCNLLETVHSIFSRNDTVRIKLAEGEIILESIQGIPSLFIFGAGHVSKSLCSTAAHCGFQVSIIDDREQYANSARFPDATKILVMDFMKFFQHIAVKPSSYLVIATRGHSFDEEILEAAIQTPARYIGMIGSTRKVTVTYRRLLEHGATVKDLKRIYAPIGLEIGAVTPEEIAISIVAQLIRLRRGITIPPKNKSEVMSSIFDELQDKQHNRQSLPINDKTMAS